MLSVGDQRLQLLSRVEFEAETIVLTVTRWLYVMMVKYFYDSSPVTRVNIAIKFAIVKLIIYFYTYIYIKHNITLILY